MYLPKAATLVLCIIAVPLLAFAAEKTDVTDSAKVAANVCAKQSESGKKLSTTNDFVKYAVSCSKKCADDKVTIKDGKVSMQTTRACSDADEKSGTCNGKITFTLPNSKKEYTVSKCSSKRLQGIAESDNSLSALAADYARQQAVDLIKEQIGEGGELSPAMQETLFKLGFGGDNAKDMLERLASDPDKAGDLLQSIVDGDAKGAADAARSLGLSEDQLRSLGQSIVALSDPNSALQTVRDILPREAQGEFQNIISAVCGSAAGMGVSCPKEVTTLAGDLEAVGQVQKASLTDELSPLCGALRSCGEACSEKVTLVCRTNNPGAAVVDGRGIAASVGCSACGAANNTACCNSMESGVAYMYKLLTGSGYLGGSHNTVQSAICKWTPATHGNDCATYSITVANQLGISPYQTIDPQDTKTVGALMMAISKYEHGRGVIFTPEQLQSGIQIALGNQPIPTGNSNFAAQFISGGTGVSSPFNMGFSNLFNGFDGSSAFSATSGFPVSVGRSVSIGTPTSGGYSSVSGGYTNTGYQSGNLSSGSILQPVSQVLLGNGQQTVSTVPQAVAIIIAQPKELSRGKPISVSWSSVGVRTDTPCQVLVGGVIGSGILSQGSEGTKSVATNATMSAGTASFTVRCTSLATGQVIERSDSVVLR